MCFLTAILAGLAGPGNATEITTVHATADTYLASGSSYKNFNFGGGDQLLVGNHELIGNFHGLLQFDLSSLPKNAVIHSVRLQMQKPSTGVGVDDFTVVVYELSSANSDWVEGFAPGGEARPGSASWNSKGFDHWEGSAGASTAETDFIDIPLASYAGSRNQGVAEFISEVAFVDAIGNNTGGILNILLGFNGSVSQSYYRFATRESVSDEAPALVIEWTK